MPTIFTKIIEGDIPSYKVAESDKFYAFLDINPIVEGHTLVVPKVETDYYFDLEDTMLAEMNVFCKQLASKISKAIPCMRVCVAVFGLDVPHAHVHLIPIQKASDFSFSNPKLKLSKDEFEKIAEAIRLA